MSQTAPYGSWPSRIKAELTAQSSLRLSEAKIHQSCIYWLEARPEEQGRVCLMEYCRGRYREVLHPQCNVRNRVHEYGGGSYGLHENSVYYCQFEDQAVYRASLLGVDHRGDPITPEGAFRFADLHCLTDAVVAVCEDHRGTQVNNYLVYIAADGSGMTTLFAESDFVSSPCYHPQTGRLAWLAWDHPDMPWDRSRLYTAVLEGGKLSNIECVLQGESSLVQPRWSQNGNLYIISDESNWWNLYVSHGGSDFLPVFQLSQELAVAPWQFANSFYDLLDDDCIIFAHNQMGKWRLSLYQEENFQELNLPYDDYTYVSGDDRRLLFCAASSSQAMALIEYDLQSGEQQLIRTSRQPFLDEAEISPGQAMKFYPRDPCYGLYYAPKNSQYEGQQEEKPPLLLLCHGGPTAAASASLDLGIQYWTNRGFAVLSLNYRGSTGYGRQYRLSLWEKWGVCDVQDCIRAVNHLIDAGLVDAERIAISGGSAGGYTVLCALCASQVFKAGCCRYGIGDLEILMHDTHKFESRYLDRLIGPFPQYKARYHDRSPVHHAHLIRSPVLFLHGQQDAVVPINQAERMHAALKKNAVPSKLVSFRSEQHGFRNAQNIVTALETELAFYTKIFGIPCRSSTKISLD